MKKILITGCNGFIGSHMVQFYKNKGYDVYGLDIRINKGLDRNKFIECDLLNDDMSKIYKEISPDIFIHCAGNASVGKSVEYPEMDFNSNVEVLYKTLSSLSRAKINPKFIFLSTAAVYGNPLQLPILENDMTSPISPYGLHKKMCEDICYYYRKINKKNIVVVRIFSAYGEGLRKQILWDMYNKYVKNGIIELYGTGNETRDFINITDVIRAMDLIVEEDSSDLVYNIGNGEEVTIRKLALEFGKCLKIDEDKIKFNGIVKEGDPMNWKADINKIKKLGYVKKIDLEVGIKKYIDWVKKID